MDGYVLQPHEVVLFKGEANVNQNKSRSQVLLTNLNLVQITKSNVGSEEPEEISLFPSNEIKMFNNLPQVRQIGGSAEIYFYTAVLNIDFRNLLTAMNFVKAVYDLVTGKSAGQRGAEAFRGAVGVVDTALGINTVETVSGIIGKSTPGAIFGSLAKAVIGGQAVQNTLANTQNTNGITAPIGQIQSNKTSMTLDEQIEALKKLKALLDAGIISDEEFSVKKAQIMDF